MSYQYYKVDPYVRIWNCIADGGEICSGGFDPKNNPDDRKKLMFAILGVIFFLLLFVCFSGCTRRVYVPVEKRTTVTETLVDTLVEVKLKEVRDTITLNTLGKDTLSYLSNDYAYSFASIENGILGHSLGINPDAKARDSVKVKHIIIRDSIPYPVEVIKEKKLSFWQSVKIEYGGFAMGVAVALAFILGLMIYTGRVKRD